MRYVLWTIMTVLIVVVVAFLHWSTPSREVVRVLGTDVKRVDLNGGDGTSRDVRFISAITEDGDARVYRNEDAGLTWPPYFKFDSANLDAEAQNAISTEADPKWVIVKSYGWRFSPMSMFPNALSISEADGPNETLIPWTFLLSTLGFLILVAIAYRRIKSWF